ncbi:MAG TPA: MlaD family protein [Solirubrobacteraceae bacterium]|nr:MlaD family protein [Solirubrobacteraceae bacterium]
MSWLRRRSEVPVSELQKRSNPLRFGAVFLVVLAILVYFGFTKHVPFKHGYRLNAAFTTAVNIATKSPVRIAGVTVGKVTSVKRVGNTGLVSMEIEGKGLPIHSDATLKIRPRIFLEGNFYVEMQPGTPRAPVLASGATIPIAQTAVPVQLDQVLDALNTDTRANLQTFLIEYGEALTRKPTAEEDAEQSPEVQGLDAAQALKKAYRIGPEALRSSALVGQALLGREPNDLFRMFASIEKVAAQLGLHEQQLGELFGHFSTFLGAFANQAPSLRRALAELPAALRNAGHGFAELYAAAPAIRAFALDLVPGVETLPPTIKAAYPFLEQIQAALAPDELGGVAKGLSTAAPTLAGLFGGQAAFLHQFDQLNQCFTKVVYPAAYAKLQDGANTSGNEAYREFWDGLVGAAGLGQNFDGNGPADRFLGGGAGTTIVSQPAKLTGGTQTPGQRLVAQTGFAPEGTSPSFPGVEPPYRPLVPCYTQKLPEFNGPLSHGAADGSGG